MKNDEICAVKTIQYEPSDTIKIQGTRGSIRRYLDAGYCVKEERNGFWVLVKKAKVIVKVETPTSTQVINMKREILDYYGKKRITEKQVVKFLQDIENKKIAICFDVNVGYLIKKMKKKIA